MFTDWSARKSAMKEVAYHLGMQYIGDEEWGMLKKLKGFSLFRKGGSKKIFNLMQKKDAFLEEQFFVFDYRYIVSTGKTTHKYYQTVFFIQSKHLGLPEFLMKPENFFDKIGAFLGMQDIDFIQHPEFSDEYLLKSEDEEYLRQVMTDDILQFFTVEKDWSLEGIGYFLVFYKNNTLLTPHTIEQFYKKGIQVYSMLALK